MIRMLGIDHTNAPVDVRSVFTFRKQEKIDIMEEMKKALHAKGVVLLSTCNRCELWVSGGDEETPLIPLFCEKKNVSAQEYAPYFNERSDREAAEHLFYLTCGLKSAIIAEDQILTQVGETAAFARAAYLSDSVLEVLFRMAVSAAKKVKTNVRFTRANNSAIAEAIEMLKGQGFSLRGKTCMVIGNGEYGKLTALKLKEQGADVTVTVRQYHSGIVMIPEGCSQIHYGEKMDFFPKCDLVVSATTSPNYTLYYDQIAACPLDHPVIIMDFAMPPDVEPSIADLPGCRVYNIDDFRTDGPGENEPAVKEAVQILEDQIREFYMWLNYRDLMPHIEHIRQEASEDVHLRLKKTIHHLDVDLAEQEALDRQIAGASGKVIAKILFMLRDELDEETFRRCVKIIEDAYMGDERTYGK